MEFRLELNIKPFQQQLNIRDKVMLIGSCFTDHMSRQLESHKFSVLENPNGILFNPASIATAVGSYIQLKTYTGDHLFFHNELWASWDHHSKFSNPGKEEALQQVNSAVAKAHRFLKETNWLIITLGSAFVYRLKDDTLNGKPQSIVANCHKVPQQHFDHKLLTYPEVETCLAGIVTSVKRFNPLVKIIFTISPVRHSREGLVENNRSKALLHTAVHSMENRYGEVYYFPAYELVIDDLRDYRFYAEDMVHPNYQATQYVWDKFSEACIDVESKGLMEQLFSIYHARNHKPLHPGSRQHQQFLASMYAKVKALKTQYPFLDLQEEEEYFGFV